MKKTTLAILALCTALLTNAQKTDSLFLIALNQQIDDYVVKRDTAALQNLYADDFVFSHGSGRVEGRQGWMGSVKKGNFLLRQHDSVTVELHPGIALVRGKLTVHKKNKEKTDRYQLKYIRLYAYRNNTWQMISHFTFWEQHDS